MGQAVSALTLGVLGLFLCAAAAQETTPVADPGVLPIPFLQVTGAIASCVPPEPTRLSPQEAVAASHYRAERGTSCYQSGRCRLPNSYWYDQEIIPRARKAILVDGRFANTSVWVEGQRRWVWLKGCVADASQAAAMEQLVRSMDDVEAVINQLTVSGAP
jgi:hypothetical protein